MGLGRRGGKQPSMWIGVGELPRSPGHVFYEKLNRLLAEADFDRGCEDLCAPYYADELGRPSIPPGVYFRMLFVGYFEGLDSQRAIAWKCADSLSVRQFLGLEATDGAPDHSSLTRIRKRLPGEVHFKVFEMLLDIARAKGILRGKTLAVDATTLEANAAMKSMVRRATGEDWKAYLRRLAAAEGIEDPSDDDLRRFDRKRKDKKVSNEEWKSPVDPDSRIMKMKDGRTHFGYKAEHAIDVESDLVVAAEIHFGDTSDGDSILMTVQAAQDTLKEIGNEQDVEDVIGDKGYHKIESIGILQDVHGVRTYIPERKDGVRHNWKNRAPEDREAFYANRRRVCGNRGRRLSRLRSEYVERSFAHACETGGARRTWLRGREKVAKRYWIHLAARNLGVMMRVLFGIGTPRSLQGVLTAAFTLLYALWRQLWGLSAAIGATAPRMMPQRRWRWYSLSAVPNAQAAHFSTGC
jgi:transposase